MHVTQQFRIRTLVVAALACAAFQLSAKAQTAQASATEDHFQRSFALAPGGTLAIKNYKGLIAIEGSSQQQVTVDVAKVYDGDSKYREEWLRGTEVNFSSAGNRLDIRVEYPQHICMFNCDENWGGQVRLTIHAPRRVNVDLDGYKPETKISAIDGDIRIHSYKSRIDIRDTAGAIDIDTYKDRITLDNVKLSGPLRVHDYKAETSINASEMAQGADLETSKGDIRVALPADIRANVDVSGGRRADIRSDFPLTSETGYDNRHIKGAINGGGPELRIRTEKGSVSLRKGGGSI
jgi:hypothetical protein